MKSGAIVAQAFVYTEETHLTVLKTSLFSTGDGFTAYDSKGKLVFRVDSYGPDAASDTGEVVLMDAAGRCILTVRRKRPSLHRRWEGFVGEGAVHNPLFSVRRSTMMGRTGMTVEVYSDPEAEYHIEGSFACRECNILNSAREVVAEIRRKKDAYANVVLGKDVFLLSLKPGFDGAFAMGFMLILDQIHWADIEEDGGDRIDVGPNNENSQFSHQ